jgi:hypothetical protein
VEVRMDFPPGTGVEPITDDENRLVGVKLTPFFTGRRTSSTVAKGVALNAQGDEKDDFHLVVSGVTGQVRKQQRTDSVVPFCDLPKDQQQQSGSDATDEEEDD